MKIRQGFISNSSSSSFVLMLPVNFDPVMYVDNLTDEEISHYKDYTREDVKDALVKIMDRKIIMV